MKLTDIFNNGITSENMLFIHNIRNIVGDLENAMEEFTEENVNNYFTQLIGVDGLEIMNIPENVQKMLTDIHNNRGLYSVIVNSVIDEEEIINLATLYNEIEILIDSRYNNKDANILSLLTNIELLDSTDDGAYLTIEKLTRLKNAYNHEITYDDINLISTDLFQQIEELADTYNYDNVNYFVDNISQFTDDDNDFILQNIETFLMNLSDEEKDFDDLDDEENKITSFEHFKESISHFDKLDGIDDYDDGNFTVMTYEDVNYVEKLVNYLKSFSNVYAGEIQSIPSAQGDFDYQSINFTVELN